MTNVENFKKLQLFNNIFDQVRHHFTIISTLLNFKDILDHLHVAYIQDITEIEKYDKYTGIMIGDVCIIENVYIYLIIFDQKILIINETDLLKILPFFQKIMSFNKNLIFYMNSRIQIILESKHTENSKKINFQANRTDHSEKVKNQIVNCIVKKSQIRTQNRRYCMNSESNQIIYKYDDFISIHDFGQALLSFNVKDQYLYVLKCFNKNYISKNHQFEHEISFYEAHNGSNPFICKYYGKLTTKENNIIIIEYIEGESLKKFIENNFNYLEKIDKFKIILEIMSVIEYMHLNGIIYRDLKYDNIIIDSKKDAIFIDFDQARSMNGDPMTVDIGSQYFIPPEQSSAKNYSDKVDIYALGKIIHFILTGSLDKDNSLDKKYGFFYGKCLYDSPELRPEISNLFNEFIDIIFDIDKNHKVLTTLYCVREKLLEFLNNQKKSGNEIISLIYFLYYKYLYAGSNSMQKRFINALKISSNQNNSDAQYYLGKFYYEGEYISRDINKSIHYLSLSANQNNSCAQYLLGEIYYEGEYISRDINKSFHYLSLSANQNNSCAQYLLGKIYYLGKYISRDINKSIYYLTLSSNQNNSDAQFYLGYIYYKGEYISRDINKSFHYLSLSANQNDSDAQYYLGIIYYFGKYISRDINKSIYYLSLSSNKNDSLAQYFLGKIYYEGEYISRDINKSFHYLTLSVNQNNSYAQYLLGKIYYEGEYISRNINKSIHYLSLSSNQNNSHAQRYLGMIYFLGKYISRDINKSMYYFTLSANQNDSYVQYLLGLIFYSDEYISQDINKSIHYLSLSANQNNSKAQYLLGKIYYSGYYISRDIKKAIYYFKESSCFYNNFAKNNLGIIYKNGDGVEKNIYNAIVYFDEAIKQKNDLYSIYNLLRIYFFVESDNSKANELIEKLSNNNFYLGDLFLYYIYTYDNKTAIDKSIYSKSKLNVSNTINSIYQVISSEFPESDVEYIFSQRLQIFFKEYDLVYSDNQDYKSDFLSFMTTGSFPKPKISKYLEERERQEKLRKNINKDFYDGFNKD